MRAEFADQTDAARMARPLSEEAEILLGLRPYPQVKSQWGEKGAYTSEIISI